MGFFPKLINGSGRRNKREGDAGEVNSGFSGL